MVLFHPAEVPGSVRYELVKEFVKHYGWVEASGEHKRNSNDPVRHDLKHARWERVRPGVLVVLHHFADLVPDSETRDFTTVMEFQTWFRRHKNPKERPWTDSPRTNG